MSVAVDFLVYAIEQEKEQAAWGLWSGLYPFMVSGLIKSFIGFDEFKRKLFKRQYQYTQKSDDEIMAEMMKVVAAHEGR